VGPEGCFARRSNCATVDLSNPSGRANISWLIRAAACMQRTSVSPYLGALQDAKRIEVEHRRRVHGAARCSAAPSACAVAKISLSVAAQRARCLQRWVFV
jgi:hypothetical protein